MLELSFDKDKLIEKYSPDFAFAYGSGVFRQEGYTEKDKPMIDFVFGVDSPLEWHRNNLDKNKNDYSFIARIFGAKFTAWIQEKGAGIYYNPYVDFEGQKIKYGVISKKRLIKDLEEWTSLYVAGRLHKPVAILKSDSNLDAAIRKNLEHALNVALLMLPERFSENELYETIAGLSYLGDSRGRFENPRKVRNIVFKNFEEFQRMYRGLVSSNQKISFSNQIFHQDTGMLGRLEAYKNIPDNLKSKLLLFFIHSDEEFRNNLKKELAKIVYLPSLVQTSKGFISAGFLKSFKYVREKLNKARR